MHKNVKKESESIIQYLSVLRGVRLTVLCEGTQGSHISHNNGSLIEQLKRPGDQYEILLWLRQTGNNKRWEEWLEMRRAKHHRTYQIELPNANNL